MIRNVWKKRSLVRLIRRRFVVTNDVQTTIEEGRAKVLINDGQTSAEESKEVFYNPVQRFNRDLSLVATLAYGLMVGRSRGRKDLSYLDAFTASG